MERSTFERFLAQLGTPSTADPLVVSADRYRDPKWLAHELATVFRAPRIVAASSDIAEGSCLPIDLPGASALLVREKRDGRRGAIEGGAWAGELGAGRGASGAEGREASGAEGGAGGRGTLRAFANACRHRGTRLVDAPCQAKAIVCPYHGWTYDLAGTNIHMPHAEAFPGIGNRDLVPIPVVERHGLVWLGGYHAGELDADLAAIDLANHVVYQRSHVERACNWKLVIEAFLDGYHIRVLHRDSIYRFFRDAIALAEPIGPHIRAVTARRQTESADLRELGTPSFVIFPSTVIIEHPDFVSVLTVYPLAPDRTHWDHMMLVPRDGDSAHWAKSWQLIEETVFQREDLWVCEQIQKSINSGATDELVFGRLEDAVRYFHDALASR